MSMHDFLTTGQLRNGRENNRTTCDDCGVSFGIGDSPWCKDGHAYAADGGLYKHTFHPYYDVDVVSDDHPEKHHTIRMSEDAGDVAQAVYVESPGHQRRLMKENGSELRSPKVGMPGCEI